MREEVVNRALVLRARRVLMRTLPDQNTEIEGRPALLSRFESATSQTAIEVISARETYEVIAVHRVPGGMGR